MDRTHVLQHFETLAETPEAVAKLRELVLQLAVRGSLVPQNNKDESGTELLKRIADEKRRLTREGLVKKTPVLQPITSEACPFVIPKNWAWGHLNDFGDWGSGSTPSRGSHEFYDGTIPWLKSGELNDGFVSDSEEKVTEFALEKCSLRLNKPGDVLFAMYGATVGKVAILGIEATTNQAVCACTCFSGVFNRYLFLLLKAYKQEFISESAGAAQPNFSKDKIIRTIAPLPPLAEQRRIVAKVEQLLALCDELEARQTVAREHRARLVRSALDHLTTANGARACDPQHVACKIESEKGSNISLPSERSGSQSRAPQNDLQRHAAFVLREFPQLTAAPEDVPAVRQTVLSLAIEGRLLKQENKDRPAHEELEQIRAKKKQLALRRSSALPTIEEKEHPFPLPRGWAWARWAEISDWITYGFTRPMPHLEKGIPIATAKHVLDGCLDLSDCHKTDEQTFAALSEKDRPVAGDILVTKDGSIGRTAIVPPDQRFCINQSVAVVWLRSCHLSREYLLLAIRSPWMQRPMWAKAEGMAIKHISVVDFGRMVVPVPPLAEQQRIVAKVEELMRWCDALEARLTAAQTAATYLLDATLRRILDRTVEGELL